MEKQGNRQEKQGGSPEKQGNRQEKQDNQGLIFGRNPVAEAIKGGSQIDKIIIAKDTKGSINKIIEDAREKGIQVRFADRDFLDRTSRTKSHQGIMAYIASATYCDLDDIIKKAEDQQEDLFLILLDGIEDPHNLGAIIRSADAAGAHGIVIPNRRASGLTDTVAKASAGAVAHVPVAKVPNIAQTIEKLKKRGVWIGAADAEGQRYCEVDLCGHIALVIGGEGSGVGKLIKEKCDFIMSIPMKGKVNSLNASNAAAVLMYEVVRQREKRQG